MVKDASGKWKKQKREIIILIANKIQIKGIRTNQGHFLMLKAAIHNDITPLLSLDKSKWGYKSHK